MMGFMIYWAIFCSHPAALQPFSSLYNICKNLHGLRYSCLNRVEPKTEARERDRREGGIAKESRSEEDMKRLW